MKPVVACWAVALLALSGCDRAAPRRDQAYSAGSGVAKPTATATAASPPYDASLPLAEFMTHVMQYAGNGVWKWQGELLDKAGEHSLYPKNDEEWEEAESGARTLAEITNLLLIPGRRIDEPGWDKAVLEVRRVALNAARAAEHHDKPAFLAAGSALDEACDSCHVRYDPTFKSAPQ